MKMKPYEVHTRSKPFKLIAMPKSKINALNDKHEAVHLNLNNKLDIKQTKSGESIPSSLSIEQGQICFDSDDSSSVSVLREAASPVVDTQKVSTPVVNLPEVADKFQNNESSFTENTLNAKSVVSTLDKTSEETFLVNKSFVENLSISNETLPNAGADTPNMTTVRKTMQVKRILLGILWSTITK